MFSKPDMLFRKTVCAVMTLLFSFSTFAPSLNAYAQTLPMNALNLPPVGIMVPASPAFAPAMIKGVTVHPDNPLKFNFIVDTGDSELQDDAIKEEATRLIKYFLATITVPEEDLWVNLSPEEKDRIIPQSFGVTEMGRDLLAQDYVLKQLTASLMYPEDELGEKFWERVYTIAKEKYGTQEIPMESVNKVWIVPEKAVVYEHQGSAYVVDSYLKVMLEQEYLEASGKNVEDSEGLNADIKNLTSEVIKTIIVPEIEKEVNYGENFARIRQVYNSMILASWYKDALKESLLMKVYADQNLVKGVDVKDKNVKQKIYDQYIEAFKEGVYNYIREDYDETTGEIVPRKYVSGGATMKIRAIREDIEGAPDQLDDKDFAIVVKGLQGTSPASQLLDFAITVVENLGDEDRATIEASRKNATVVSTQRVENPETGTAAAEDSAMATDHKQVADILIVSMKNSQSIMKRVAASEAVEIGLDNETIKAINDDISVPLWISGSAGTEINVMLIPQMSEKVKAAAEKQLNELMGLYAQIKAQLHEMETAVDEDVYLSSFESANQIFEQIQKALSSIRVIESKNFSSIASGDKIKKAIQVTRNTIKHQFSQKINFASISPRWLKFDSDPEKKSQRFKLVNEGIQETEILAEQLLNISRVPQEETKKNFFDLQDLADSQQMDLETLNIPQAREMASQIEQLLNDKKTTTYLLKQEDLETIPLTPEIQQRINRDISIPLIIDTARNELYDATSINLPYILKTVAMNATGDLRPIIEKIKKNVKEMKTASNKNDYILAHAEIPRLMYELRYKLKLLVYQYPLITVQTLYERKKQNAEQILKNTLAYYIIDHMSFFEIAPENLPFLASSEEKQQKFDAVETDLNQTLSFIAALLSIERVPQQVPNDVIMDIHDVFAAAQKSEDYAMAVPAYKKSATEIEETMKLQGQASATFAPNRVKEWELTPENIHLINQDITLGLFISQLPDDSVRVERIESVLEVANVQSRREWTNRIQYPLEQYEKGILQLKQADSQRSYASIYEKFDSVYYTLANAIQAIPAFNPATEITNKSEKIQQIQRIVSNTLSYHLSGTTIDIHKLNPNHIAQKGDIAKNFALFTVLEGIQSIKTIFGITDNLQSFPQIVNDLSIFDLNKEVQNKSKLATEILRDAILFTMESQGVTEITLSPTEAAYVGLDSDENIKAINQDISGPLWITGEAGASLTVTYLSEMPEALREDAEEKLSLLLGVFTVIQRSMTDMKTANNSFNYTVEGKNIVSILAGIAKQLKGPELYIAPDQRIEIVSAETKIIRAKQLISNTIRQYISNKSTPLAILDPEMTPFNNPDKVSSMRLAEKAVAQINAVVDLLINMTAIPKVNTDGAFFDLDEGISNRVKDEDFSMAVKTKDVAMLTREQIAAALQKNLFDFTYPGTMEDARGSRNRYLEWDFYMADQKRDLIGLYTLLVLLRHDVGQTQEGQPYDYLTQKINALEAFADEQKISLPSHKELLPQEGVNNISLAEIYQTAHQLKIQVKEVKFALMLGLERMPYDLYREFGWELSEEEILHRVATEISPEIFIQVLRDAMLKQFTEEKIVETLESKGLFPAVTKAWKGIKTKEEDFAIMTQEQLTRAVDLGLFDFVYPTVMGNEKKIALTLKVDLYKKASEKTDLRGFYVKLVALRKAVGASNSRGRPYHYLSEKIRAIEVFAAKEKIRLPRKETIWPDDFQLPNPAENTYAIERLLKDLEDIDQAIQKLRQGEAVDNLVAFKKLGELKPKSQTNEEWIEFFQSLSQRIQRYLFTALDTEKILEESDPMQADREKQTLINLSRDNQFSQRIENQLSDKQAGYEYVTGPEAIAERLQTLEEKLESVKTNLLVLRSKRMEKVFFFDAEKYIANATALHVIKYNDQSVNAVIVLADEDYAVATQSQSSLEMVHQLQTAFNGKIFHASNGKNYLLIPHIDYQEKSATYFIDFDIKEGVDTNFTRAMHMVIKEERITQFEMDLTQLRFTDTNETTNLSETDLSIQIMDTLKSVFPETDISLIVSNMKTRITQIETGGLLISRYDPQRAQTFHYYEGAAAVAQHLKPVILIGHGDERQLPIEQVMQRYNQENFSAATDAAFLNMLVEQSFERLTTLVNEGIALTLEKAKMGTKPVTREFAGQLLSKTLDEWIKIYRQMETKERENYRQLLAKKSLQEDQTPTEADEDVAMIEAAIEANEFQNNPDDGILTEQLDYQFIQGNDNVFVELKEIRKNLTHQKVNILVPGALSSITLYEVFDMMKTQNAVTLHILKYDDGSINLIFNHSQSEDFAILTQITDPGFRQASDRFAAIPKRDRKGVVVLAGPGTMFENGITESFTRYLINHINNPLIQDRLNGALKQYTDKDIDIYLMREITVNALQGLMAEDIQKISADWFAQEYAKKIIGPMKAFVDNIKIYGKNPNDIFIVANSLSWPIKGAAAYFGIPSDNVIAIEPTVYVSGKLMGGIFYPPNIVREPNTWKYDALKKRIGEQPILLAAGGTMTEAAILQEAQIPLLIQYEKQDSELISMAQAKGWEIATPEIKKPEANINQYRRVLVAIKTPRQNRIIQKRMNDKGKFLTASAGNGNLALQLLREGLIADIVLTDNKSLIKTLQKEYPDVKVVTYAPSTDGEKLKEENVLAHLSSKKVSPEALSDTLLQTLWEVDEKNKYGGIDFTRGMLNLEIKRDGKGVPLPISDQQLDSMKIEGFFPVIINVTPIQNLPFLLGMSEREKQKIAKK